MSTQTNKATITISLTELEAIIRRVVQEAVHEELMRLLRKRTPSPVDDWEHEGLDDPQGDEELLTEALAMSERYRESKAGWKGWEDFKEELKAAEVAGELPD